MLQTTMSIEQFIDRFDVGVTATRIAARTDRGRDDWDQTANHWAVTMTMGGTVIWQGEFSMGSGLVDRRGRPQMPDAYSVLCSLRSDAIDSDQDFEDWADGLGYDSDSIKAKGIWEACNAIRRTLRDNMGSAWAVLEEQAEDGGGEPDEAELHDRFKDEVLPSVIARYGPDDEPAISEAFCNWIDALSKDGEITEWLANNINQPDLSDRDKLEAATRGRDQ